MSQVSAKNNENKPADRATQDLIVLEALENAAASVGVEVRYDKLATGDVKATSGLCKIRGVDTVIVDRRLPTKERIAALTRELAGFRFDDVFLPPAVRKLLDPGENGGQGGTGHEKA
jgi:hypothetical protein